MKKLHLISNAHLDPIWQWTEEEGISAALSTFKSAAKLVEKYGFVFCHNEVVLYKYAEQYAPELFEDIKRLVREGKWHIMGGWYLQPDCNMPSGESLVRQILVGHKYFMEKFGVKSEIAANFDPFGHSRGLVQIIRKCGQTGYVFMRPFGEVGRMQLKLPSECFLWKGFDGSTIKAVRTSGYKSLLGQAVKKIKNDAAAQSESDVGISLWGVGNHGGGPSECDLKDIEKFIGEADFEVVHSTPENFFSEVEPQIQFDKSLLISMPGCYTSMSRVKQRHIALENMLYFTEKLCSVAALAQLIEYPQSQFDEAVEDLLNAEFHDVLPGSCIKAGEENGIKLLEHGMAVLTKLRASAFFALSSMQKPAKEGEYPVLVFNPHPYELRTNVEVEFSLADQNWDDNTQSNITVYDKNNTPLVRQMLKEDSNINLDWRKKVVFEAVLPPLSAERFSIYTTIEPKKPQPERCDYSYSNQTMSVRIDEKTGLLADFSYCGKSYLKNGFLPVLCDDNADPWAMSLFQSDVGMGGEPKPFSLSECGGIFSGLKSVEIIEDGDIYLGIEAFFEKDNTKIRNLYKIYKNAPIVDVCVDVFWQEADKMLKMELPVCDNSGYIGQTAYGTDQLFTNGRECVSQRFSAIRTDGGKCFAIINDCIYGSSYKNDTISLSLLRGAAYCSQPIGDRKLLPDDRFIRRMDIGEHNFSFRLTVCDECELERLAEEFNQKPYALNVFPIELPRKSALPKITVDDSSIVLKAFKKSQTSDGYILRLFNNCSEPRSCTLNVNDCSLKLSFGKYEFATVRYTDRLEKLDLCEI